MFRQHKIRYYTIALIGAVVLGTFLIWIHHSIAQTPNAESISAVARPDAKVDLEAVQVGANSVDQLAAPVGAEWNDLSVRNLKPSLAEARSFYFAKVPKEQRASTACRISRILAEKWASPEYATHLLPLKGWQGHNIFLVRRKVQPYYIQIEDTGYQITLQVQKIDGSPLLEQSTPSEAQIKQFASIWLPSKYVVTHGFPSD